jgi:hypothetical protein
MSTKHRAGRVGMGLKRPISLVVIEAGASWPGFLNHERLAPDCDVLAQQPDESFVALTRRVIARIRALTSEGCTVVLGVIATGIDGSGQALECRYRIGRALVAARGASAELVFAASDASPRYDLFALAAALHEGVGGIDFAVSVRAAATTDGPRSRAA